MKWIVSLITVLFLIVLIYVFMSEKEKNSERKGIIMILFSFLVYHIGDFGLWYGFNYELVRRVASIGFYFEIPFMLLLMYYLIPKEKRSMFMRVFSLIMMLPWLAALILVYGYPLVFLEEHGGKSENLMYALVLSFIIAVVFMSVYGYKAARYHDDQQGKRLARAFAHANIVLLVLDVFFWSTMDVLQYDATFLFGIGTIIWSLFILSATRNKAVQDTKM